MGVVWKVAGAAASAANYRRPRMVSWGASDEELARTYPGAALAHDGTVYARTAESRPHSRRLRR